ncbi:MAG: DUF4173 domain-containing protein [Rhizobiaceae bacterium]
MDMINDKTARTGETIFAAIGLTALSDFLLFDGLFGLSLVLLGLASSLVALAINRDCSRPRLIIGAVTSTLALLPILENISPLSVCVFVSLSAIGTLILSDDLQASLSDGLWRLARFFLTLPARSTIDIVRWRKVAKAVGAPVLRFAALGVWIMPLFIGLVFLALFEDANPVIAAFIAKIDLWYVVQFLDVDRVIFWAIMFALIWPFLKARLPVRKAKVAKEEKPEDQTAAPAGQTLESILFGPAAILRSLLVFNGLFALQTLLDATYLIGGAALPEGMTYANYAHRGAYPLIVTALLAAGFVLIALRKGSAARDSSLIRGLVYVWVAQNVVLVLSSVLRLDLYVSTYGLTYWRVAAFIWMGLVALGLLTIIWRIWAGKSAEWLVGINLVTSAVVLYISCFVNFGGIITEKNVSLGLRDVRYATMMGASALPAIDNALKVGTEAFVYHYNRETYEGEKVSLAKWRTLTASDFLSDHQQWRSWTLRNWRLKRYLDQYPVVISKVSPQQPEIRR